MLRGSTVLIGTDFRDDTGIGHVYAFDQQSGAVKWKRQATRGFPTDLEGSNGQTYAVTFGGELLALDDTTGVVRWNFTQGAVPTDSRPAAPAAAGGRVFFAAADGKIYALDAISGRVQWTRALGSPVRTSVTVAGNAILVGTEDGRVCRLAPRDGSVLVCRTFDESPSGKPAIAGESVVLLFAGSNGCCASLAGLDSSLRTRWTQRPPRGSLWDTFRPLVWKDVLLIGSDHGELFAFGVNDGSLRWSRKFDGAIRSVGSSGGTLYVGTLRGLVYAFEPGGSAKD